MQAAVQGSISSACDFAKIQIPGNFTSYQSCCRSPKISRVLIITPEITVVTDLPLDLLPRVNKEAQVLLNHNSSIETIGFLACGCYCLHSSTLLWKAVRRLPQTAKGVHGTKRAKNRLARGLFKCRSHRVTPTVRPSVASTSLRVKAPFPTVPLWFHPSLLSLSFIPIRLHTGHRSLNEAHFCLWLSVLANLRLE